MFLYLFGINVYFGHMVFNLSVSWSNIWSYVFYLFGPLDLVYGPGLFSFLIAIFYFNIILLFCHYFYPEVVFSIKKNTIQECICFYQVHIREQEITKVPTWQGFPTRVSGILELFGNPTKVCAWFLREPFIIWFLTLFEFEVTIKNKNFGLNTPLNGK